MGNSYEQIVEICSAASACFSYTCWTRDVKPEVDKLGNFMPYEYGAIKISCLIASLLAIRKFDDFFRDTKSRHDDVSVSDFKFDRTEILSNSERKNINKKVAHFTSEMNDNRNECWDIDGMLIRVSVPLKKLLDYLVSQCGDDDVGIIFEITETIKFIDLKVKLITS